MTGAGVSAASGVPTFRGPDGLWRQHRPEDLATPDAFARDPQLVWDFYAWRRERIRACQPNRAHAVLAAWTRRHPACRLITQNVDDLHLRAGSRDLVRLHGSVWELACWNGCRRDTWHDEGEWPAGGLPRCPRCAGLARPAVIWFGERLRSADIDAALDACACDVFLAVGTSAVVYPAAAFLHEARARGAFTVEVNPEATPSTSLVDLAIAAPAEDALPAIDPWGRPVDSPAA